MDIEEEVRKKFNVYHKQVDAFEYQKKFPQHRSFSFEMPNPYMTQGRRKFFIADLRMFWVWYRNFYTKPRHFYELIQEGYPCRLYFDLEYQKETNPDLEEDKALSEFLEFVCVLVKETYGIEITEKSFILLDSTTEKKFSVHAICHFPNNVLFPSNVAMREFIAKLTQRMSETGVGIVKKDNEETFICDPAVYTKNRSFRILLSSKCGKDVVFKYRKSCKFYDTIPADDIKIFLDSVVVPPDFSNAPLLNIAENKGRVLKRNRILRTANQAASMPISHFASKLDTPFEIETIDSGNPPSPFPELDEYVREFNTQYSKNVEIRTWTLLYLRQIGSMRVQYQLNNCRYCLRMQREHQSNNVYWTCQIEREWMFQKCFDYDCHDFISNFFPIPSAVLTAIKPQVEKVFPKFVPTVPKYLPPLKDNIIKAPMKQLKVDDSFNDSARDREILAAVFPGNERKRHLPVDEILLKPKEVKIPRLSLPQEDSFFSTSSDEKILEAVSLVRNNNTMAKSEEEVIDLTEDKPTSPKVKDTTGKPKTPSKKSTPKSSKQKYVPKKTERLLLFGKKKPEPSPKFSTTEFFKKATPNKKTTSKKPVELIDLADDDGSSVRKGRRRGPSPDMFSSPSC